MGAWANLNTNLAGQANYVQWVGYTNIGQVSGRRYGTDGVTGSVARSFGYDTATRRLTNLTARTPSTAASDNTQNTTIGYANTGEVTQIADVVDNQRECFTYDGLSRLTLAGTTPFAATGCSPDMVTGPSPHKEAYSYDDDGNLTQLVRSSTPSAATTWNYSYGATTLGSTALTGGPHALTVVRNGTTATTGYAYDGAGRQVTKTNGSGTSPVASTWNGLGQLAAVNGTATTATYGPDGSRWVRTAVNGGTTTTTVYLPGQEVKRAVTSGSGTTSAVRYYSHGGDTIATRPTATGLAWVLGNYQASNTIAVTAATGAITRDRYTPYGLNRAGAVNSGFTLAAATGSDRGWLDRTRDDQSGLDYLNARYYDPGTAHFISPDPVNNQDAPQAANPYTYGDDNPATLSDPDGLEAQSYCNTSACAAKSTQSIALYNKNLAGKAKTRVVAAVRIAPKKLPVIKAVAKTVVKVVVKAELSRTRGGVNALFDLARDAAVGSVVINPSNALNAYKQTQQLAKLKTSVNRSADARGIAGSGAAYQTGYWTTTAATAIPGGGGGARAGVKSRRSRTTPRRLRHHRTHRNPPRPHRRKRCCACGTVDGTEGLPRLWW